MNLADKTLSYVYYTSLSKCIRDAKINDNNTFDGQLLISPDSINQGLWFRNEQWNNSTLDGPSMTRASYLAPGVDTDSGEVTCNTVVKEATKLWGFDNPKDLYCSFVTERANGSSCATGNGDFGKDEFIGHQADFQKAITRLVYGGTNPSLFMSGFGSGYPGRYLIYQAAFMKGCQAKEAANPSADFRYKVTLVGDDGKTSEKTFEGSKRDTTRYVYVDRDNLNDIALTCAQIADRMNTYATDYALYRGDNQQESTSTSTDSNAGTDGSSGTTSSVSACAIDGVGWIICPVVNFLAGLADGSFKILSDSLLRVDVALVDTSSPTYTAWTTIRNLANILFVIIFLIIIFSQLSGVGVSNYGVKKMLPRLVIAAILVNISFFVCQIAVDISNILGYSINDALGGVGDSIITESRSLDGVSPFADGGGFLGIAGSIIAIAAGGVLIYAMLSVFIPVLLAIVVALVMILFILIARQALIVILIVLAPLAFVAFLLPNTERLFKTWQKMFMAMLLLFPIIALVFGLSSVAADILATTFSGDLGDSDANNWFGQIVAAAVLVLPLFIVPTLLKKSLDGIPVLGQMASKWANKATGNVSGKLRESHSGSLVGRGRAIRKNAREAYRGRKFAERLTEGRASGLNKVLASGIPTPGAGVAANKTLSKTATAAMVKARNEEISDARSLIEEQNLSGKQRQDLAMGRPVLDKNNKPIKGLGGDAMQKAALQMQLGGAGSWGEVQEIVSASSSSLSKFSASIGAQAGASSGKDPAFSGKRIDQISQGNFNYESAVAEAITEGKYTAEAFASMNDGAREQAITIARQREANGDPSLVNALKQAAEGIRASSEISGKVAGNAEAQRHIEGLIGAVGTAQPSNPQTAAPAQAQPNGGLVIAHGAQQVHAAAQQAAQQPPAGPGGTPPTQPPTTP